MLLEVEIAKGLDDRIVQRNFNTMFKDSNTNDHYDTNVQ